MAGGQGMMLTTSDSATLKETISDWISIVDPMDTPCISLFGLDNGARFKFQNFPNHKIQWMFDHYRTRTATVDDVDGLDTDDTEMVVDSTDSHLFKPGDVWLTPNGEKIWVSDVNYTTHTVTIVRGWGSTSGAAIANNAVVTYLFSARLEGDDSDTGQWRWPEFEYNFSQIMHDEVKISRDEAKMRSRWGIPDTLAYRIQKALGGLSKGPNSSGAKAGDLYLDIENTFFYGERIERVGQSVAGAMGGVHTYITSNLYDMSGGLLTLPQLNEAIQASWSEGGMPDTILCSPFNKQLMATWFGGSVRTERAERTGGITIDTIHTDFGDLDIVMSRRVPSDNVYILQRDLIGWVTLDPWEVEELGKTGDGERHQIVGEYSFVVKDEQCHAIIENTAVSFDS